MSIFTVLSERIDVKPQKHIAYQREISSYRYIICNSLLDKSLFVCPLDEDADKDY